MKDKYVARFLAVTSILTISLILGGCGQKTAGQSIPPEVAVVTIQPKPIVLKTELTGRTSANLIAEVRPQVGGIIKKRFFTEGSNVQAGQVLYQIDPDLYQATLARSEANLTALQLKVDRFRELLIDKAVSQQEFDDAAAALKQTQADIQTARINLKYTSITAPITGRIGKSSVTEGALVTAQQPTPLATIQQLNPVYVDVPQSTAELLRLQNRMKEGYLVHNGANQKKVQLVLEDGTVYPLQGTLQFQDITVDPSTGSVILRVVFPNPKGVLLPGMFVRTFVQEGIKRKAILVPQQAVSRDPMGNPLTLIVDNENKVQLRKLTVDRTIDDKWLVTDGLKAGDRVIVEGMLKVMPGVLVKAVPFENGSEKNDKKTGNTPPQSAKRTVGGK